jgi:hypothetical protein
MKFNISVIHPANYRFTHFLYPMSKLLCSGLESLGHDCCMTRNRLDANRMTILVGGHLLESSQDVEKIAGNGPYIVYQTELLDSLHFMGVKDYLQVIYAPLLQRARAVWEATTPIHLPLYEKLGVRAHLLLGGYHPDLEEVVHKRAKDIDFLFYGSVTPHRQEMLRKLEARGHKLITIFDEPAHFRNDYIARTKVHVAPCLGTALNPFSWTRVCFLLNNRSLIVAEHSSGQEWLQDCFLWADSEHWVDLCEQTLLRPDRELITWDLCERYKQRPYVNLLQKALDVLK